MSQRPYLARLWRGDIAQVESLTNAHYPEVRKITGERDLGGFTIVNRERTGRRDRNTIAMVVDNDMIKMPATREGVKSRLRALREREAEELDAIDAEIVELQAALAAKRAERKALLKMAWAKANVVHLKDVTEIAERKLQ